jgi:predicted acyl esterase
LGLNSCTAATNAATFSGGSVLYSRFDSPVWPPEGVTDVKFYFNPGGKLSNSHNSDVSHSDFTFKNEIKDHNMSLLNAINYGFTGSFDNKFRKDEVKFDTAPLEKDTRMAGTPRAMIYYSSDADICQYNFQIWEISADGSEDFVTSINYTDRNYTEGRARKKLIDGDSYGHIFKIGSRIRIIVTNLDTRPNDSFLRTYPYVLPVMKNAANKIYMSDSKASYISIPLMQ